MMREGQRVMYVGLGDGIQPGEVGKLLVMASATAAHMQVESGAVYLVAAEDLVPVTGQHTASADLLADSLEYGGLTTLAAREVYDTEGSAGVIEALASQGHLSGFAAIAEEAISLVASRIRTDPSLREVLASLDEEEGEAVVRRACAALIREAFEEEE